jgi:hypothetical protein
MLNFISRKFNDKTIRFDPKDRRVCLTDICTAAGKNVADFLRLQNTTDYINALSRTMGIPMMMLLEVARGNTGTWGHPQLAIKCAAWCSPDFEVLVTTWVYEILTTGKVELDLDRVKNMASSVAIDKSPQDKINLPGWLMAIEMVEMCGGDGKLATNRRFRYFISRQLADLYRSKHGQEPPKVSRNKRKGFAYPSDFKDLARAYILQWQDVAA